MKIEVRKTDGGSVISGYGAVFYRESDPGTEYSLWLDIVERILPGAFDRALREDDVRSCLNHDLNFILGRTSAGTLKLSLDAVGLRYEVTPSDSAIAQHAVRAVERGDVTGSSFMFEVKSANWIEEKQPDGSTRWIREITEVAPLYEIGPVCFPAYESTTAGIRSAVAEGVMTAQFRAWHAGHVARAKESLAAWQTGEALLRQSRSRCSLRRAQRRLRVRV